MVVPVPVSFLQQPDGFIISGEFCDNVLTKIQSDEIGSVCCKDVIILYLGHVFYQKHKRKFEKTVEVKK